MSNHDRHLICYFGILNLNGLMGIKDTKTDVSTGKITTSDVILPLYSHETYKIKTTFNRNHVYKGLNETIHQNGSHFAKIHVYENSNKAIQRHDNKYYQKFFRKDVMWDFGDGTKIEGYSAEHSYKKPGRYKITCTFFDIDRKAWVNDYSINVTVKEVLPTILKFDTKSTKSDVKCSKIERIARIEALNSNTVEEDLNVKVERIFTKQQHKNNYIEINKNYNDVKSDRFGFVEQYWSILENKQTLFYNSNDVYTNYLQPSEIFHPKYNEIFGKFFYNEAEDKMDVSLYQVIPYKNIDDNLKTITILDPNSSVLNFADETQIEVEINQVYTTNQLPSDVISMGKRGWFDIFYKNDFCDGETNTLSISYDIENQNITGELDSGTNYLNINPLGISVNVVKNDPKDVRIGYSLDGFIRPLEGDDISKGEYFIDQHLYNTLFMGIDLDTYMFPYIPYDGNKNEYYIPKDINFSITPYENTINGGTNQSLINKYDYFEKIYPWFCRIPIIVKQYINIMFNVEFNDRTIKMSLVKKRIPSPNKTVIPKELQSEEDIDRLLDVYMSHPMWKDNKNVRDMFKAMLNNGDYLTRILTTSKNFLDDTANVKRCFLSNLIAMLQMMGEDVTLYESGAFEGINDLRDFVRLLSMNHTELIGHVVKEDLDILVTNDIKGANVGEEILPTDVICINDNCKISKVNDSSVLFNDGVDLIIHDRYTNDTKIVTFNSIFNGKNFPIDGSALPFTNPLKISDYQPWWGWGLLLPESFTTVDNKIVELSKKLNNRAISRSAYENYTNEINRLKRVKAETINGYYTFHLLIPTRNNVRTGNFIDDRYVTSRIESNEDWTAQWGISHEVLMKIFIDNGFLKNDRGDDFDNRTEDTITYNISKCFEKNEIETTIKVNGIKHTYDVSGSVRIVGEVLDKTGNLLTISLNDGLIANRDYFSMIDGTIEISIDDDGNIKDTKNEFSILGNRVNGTLTLSVSGKVKNPEIKITADLDYSPVVTKNIIDKIVDLRSPVYLDDVIQPDTEFIGKILISGEITGVGNNTLTVEFVEGTVLYNGEPACDEKGNPYDSIILERDEDEYVEGRQNLINVVVNDEGKIYQKIESFKIINDPTHNRYKVNWEDANVPNKSNLPNGMMYKYRTALGEIRLVIEGYVTDVIGMASSSLFIKSPDFIELPNATKDNPLVVKAYTDHLGTFKLYSTYERQLTDVGKTVKYKEVDIKIEDFSLNLYNPRYEYNTSKCWMDGWYQIKLGLPARVIDRDKAEWEATNYPQDYYSGGDDDMPKYESWDDGNLIYTIPIEEPFEFDTIVGDMTKQITQTHDLTKPDDKDSWNIITNGSIKCTFDGCIDDRIGIAGSGDTRDIRIVIDENEVMGELRGVYAALFDIDDEYDLTSDADCSLLTKDTKICKVHVKNNTFYPMHNKVGRYHREDTVSVDLDFILEDGSILHTSKSEGTFALTVDVDKDALMTHEDMVFNVKTDKFKGVDGRVFYIKGTITVGLDDNSCYFVKDADLVSRVIWTLIEGQKEFGGDGVVGFSGKHGSIRGISIVRPNIELTEEEIIPDIIEVEEDELFDVLITFGQLEDMLEEGVVLKIFDIGGYVYPILNDSKVLKGCSLNNKGVLSLGDNNDYDYKFNFWYHTEAQNTSVNFEVKPCVEKIVEEKIYLSSDFLDVNYYEQYTRFDRVYEYRWSAPGEDEDEEVLNFKNMFLKQYTPADLDKNYQWLSVNGDSPHLQFHKKPDGTGEDILDYETGGLKITTSTILQDEKCYVAVASVATAVDCHLIIDDNKNGNWDDGDTLGSVQIPTSTFISDINGHVSEEGLECEVDEHGNITSSPLTITVNSLAPVTASFKIKQYDLNGKEQIVDATYDYEMSGMFMLNTNEANPEGKQFNVLKDKEILNCHSLVFSKTSTEIPEIPDYVMIEYNDQTGVVDDFELRGLADGSNLFYGHTLNSNLEPDVNGNVNRISGVGENGVVQSFDKQLGYLQIASNMFDGCVLNESQVKGIIDSLDRNTFGGNIEVGVDKSVVTSQTFADFVLQKTGQPFTNNEIILPLKQDANGNTSQWRIKLIVNN